MSWSQKDVVQGAIAHTMHRLFLELDERRYSAVANLFAADGIWHRQGKILDGRAAIQQALEQRSSDLTTRHLVANSVVEITGEQAAKSTHYVQVFAHRSDASRLALPDLQPIQVSVYDARWRQAGDEWQIVELAGDPSFRRAEGN